MIQLQPQSGFFQNELRRLTGSLVLGLGILAWTSACTLPPGPPATEGQGRVLPRAESSAASHSTAPGASHSSPDGPSPGSAAHNKLGPSSTDPGGQAGILPNTEPRPLPVGGGARATRATKGLVVSVEANATRAGIQALERGGNAVDAAVAVAYALAVTHPSAGNLGGGGFMVVHLANQPTVTIDFRETAPQALTRRDFDAIILTKGVGPLAVGVPGTVAGLELAHARFGKLPRSAVLEAAIHLARDGHSLGVRQAQALGWAWPVLKQDPEARRIFGSSSGPKGTGDHLVQKDLARVLERIQTEGAPGFYRGPTAEALTRRLGHGGLLRQDDLDRYRAVIREPLRFRYRGLDLETMPPPSAGGLALAQILISLEKLSAHRLSPNSAEEMHLFLESSRRAQLMRRTEVADPDLWGEEETRKKTARWLDPNTLWEGMPPIDREHATPSSVLHPDLAQALAEPEHTTHFSVLDGEGGLVSCTTTLSAGYGARLVAPETGVVLNNSVASFSVVGANLPVGGRRTVSSMAPTLVFRDGQPLLILGTPGGDTIPSTLAQVFRHLVDHAMPLDLAVDAPRVHQGFLPDAFRTERDRPLPRAVRLALEKMGHPLSKTRLPMGHANEILILGKEAFGYADPREGGLAMAVQ